MEIIEQKMVTRTFVKEIECDKCRKIIKKDNSFDAFKSTLEITEGRIYPDDIDTTLTHIDLCKECTIELTKYLESNGYRLNKTDGY